MEIKVAIYKLIYIHNENIFNWFVIVKNLYRNFFIYKNIYLYNMLLLGVITYLLDLKNQMNMLTYIEFVFFIKKNNRIYILKKVLFIIAKSIENVVIKYIYIVQSFVLSFIFITFLGFFFSSILVIF